MLISIAFFLAGGTLSAVAGTGSDMNGPFLSDLLHILSNRTFQLCLIVGTLLAFEILVVGWRASSVFRLLFRRSTSAVVDSAFFIYMLLKVNKTVEIALTFGFSIIASRLVLWISSYYGWERISLSSDTLAGAAIGLPVYWLVFTFFGYWGHRLMHHPVFWHLHRFHHAPTELNLLTVFRQHPVEPVVTGLFSIVSPMIFFNVSDGILLEAFVLGTAFDLLAHSQLEWGYGWFGRWVVASPAVHQIHHSIDEEHRDLHFSNCPLWDHLFGTWYKGTKTPSAFGIPDRAYENQPLRQLLFDTLIFYKTVTQCLMSPLWRLRRFKSNAPPVH